jgi:hypothetical protein
VPSDPGATSRSTLKLRITGAKVFASTERAMGRESAATFEKVTVRSSTRSPRRSQRTTCSATFVPEFRKALKFSGEPAIWLMRRMSRPRIESGSSKWSGADLAGSLAVAGGRGGPTLRNYIHPHHEVLETAHRNEDLHRMGLAIRQAIASGEENP